MTARVRIAAAACVFAYLPRIVWQTTPRKPGEQVPGDKGDDEEGPGKPMNYRRPWWLPPCDDDGQPPGQLGGGGGGGSGLPGGRPPTIPSHLPGRGGGLPSGPTISVEPIVATGGVAVGAVPSALPPIALPAIVVPALGAPVPRPPSGAGYGSYLRSAGTGEVAAVALPGLVGILLLTGAGGTDRLSAGESRPRAPRRGDGTLHGSMRIRLLRWPRGVIVEISTRTARMRTLKRTPSFLGRTGYANHRLLRIANGSLPSPTAIAA